MVLRSFVRGFRGQVSLDIRSRGFVHGLLGPRYELIRGLHVLGATLLVFLPQSAGAEIHIASRMAGGLATGVDNHATAATPTFTAAGTSRGMNAHGADKAVAAPPTAPRFLAADPGDEEVVLAWVSPASDGGSEITHYEYRHAAASDRSPTAGRSWRVARELAR